MIYFTLVLFIALLAPFILILWQYMLIDRCCWSRLSMPWIIQYHLIISQVWCFCSCCIVLCFASRVSKKHSSLMPSGSYIERVLFRKLFHSPTRGVFPARTKDAVVMVLHLQMVTDAGGRKCWACCCSYRVVDSYSDAVCSIIYAELLGMYYMYLQTDSFH